MSEFSLLDKLRNKQRSLPDPEVISEVRNAQDRQRGMQHQTSQPSSPYLDPGYDPMGNAGEMFVEGVKRIPGDYAELLRMASPDYLTSSMGPGYEQVESLSKQVDRIAGADRSKEATTPIASAALFGGEMSDVLIPAGLAGKALRGGKKAVTKTGSVLQRVKQGVKPTHVRQSVSNAPIDPSRRKFMKQTAIGTAAATTAGITAPIVRKMAAKGKGLSGKQIARVSELDELTRRNMIQQQVRENYLPQWKGEAGEFYRKGMEKNQNAVRAAQHELRGIVPTAKLETAAIRKANKTEQRAKEYADLVSRQNKAGSRMTENDRDLEYMYEIQDGFRNFDGKKFKAITKDIAKLNKKDALLIKQMDAIDDRIKEFTRDHFPIDTAPVIRETMPF